MKYQETSYHLAAWAETTGPALSTHSSPASSLTPARLCFNPYSSCSSPSPSPSPSCRSEDPDSPFVAVFFFFFLLLPSSPLFNLIRSIPAF